METVTRKHVVIGGTFACDEALAVPLQYLVKNAVWNVDVDLQWLGYGSLTDFDDWSADVLYPSRPVDLVLMLVRLSDLEAAHPELHFTQKSDESVSAEAGIADSPINPINQFLSDLERYDAADTVAPLVILLCPCPPVTAERFDALEHKVLSKIDAMRNVAVQSSSLLMGLFARQYTTAFYDGIADKRQHSPYTQSMLNVLSLSLCRQICRLFRTASSRKKVIVLDCDNTLWGGAVAEVGPNGIDLAPRFLALQRFVVAQQQRGMLLALCSKNILEDVRAAFTQRRGDMIIDMDKHVVATKVNWQPKSENIAQLAKELSIGLDSFIFIDDNPLECNEVATALSTVTVISLGEDFPESILDHIWVFDDGLKVSSRGSTTRATTEEDDQRTQLYQRNLAREQLRESTSTHKAFLSALGVKIVFEELNREQELRERSSSFTRALQLHHRTNQFNTATTFAKRMEEEALLDYVGAPDHTVICAHVTDRFGHYGLVCVALCQHERMTNVLRVDSFLLSCRALNRGVEHAMMRKLSEVAARTGVLSLEFAWEPTERNQPAYAFFSALSDVIFAPKHYHQCKEQLSSSSADTWVIATDKAGKVSFLKADNSHRSKVKEEGFIGWLLQLRSGQWLRDLGLSVVRWMLSSIILPSWIAQLLKPSVVRRLGGVGTSGLLRFPLRNRGSLEQFLSPILRDMPIVNNIVAGSAASIDDDKFRRKARHQTKLALVNHLHEEAPRVIWSANRPHSDGQAPVNDNLDASANVTGPTTRLQLICASTQCTATIQRESRCAFQRCRNCCYRIQRLLARSLHHANDEARMSAAKALQVEFDASPAGTKEGLLSGPETQWCIAHKNKRRRGEVLKKSAN